MTASPPDQAALSARIVDLLARELGIAPGDIRPDLPLTRYGLDSIAALTIAGELEDELGLRLESTLLWDRPTIHALASHLAALLAAGKTTELVS